MAKHDFFDIYLFCISSFWYNLGFIAEMPMSIKQYVDLMIEYDAMPTHEPDLSRMLDDGTWWMGWSEDPTQKQRRGAGHMTPKFIEWMRKKSNC